jgi:predicted nucleotidyltransferase
MKLILDEQQYKVYVRKLVLENINLSSFEMQDTLSPDIFDEDEMMLPEVRKVLLQIGKDFYEYLGTPWVDLQDIILTGSLANYNWSKFSDVDLHIVISYEQISKNKDLVEEFTWTKKELWNEEHDIKIKDYEVEVYAQDTEEDLVAGGVYSVLYDKWLKKPERKNVNLDANRINALVEDFEDKIGDLFRKFLAGDKYGLADDIDDLKADIRDLRKQGLATGGEFSPENIAFKALRRMGLMDKLGDMKSELYDDEMSIDKSRAEKAADGDLEKKQSPAKEPEKEKEAETGEGKGRYMIQGRRFNSLRKAEKVLGIPKSTIEYRVKSDNPQYSSYKELPQG